MTKVLLAEDDSTISEPLTRALRREGYDVSVRADGVAALAAASESPDLVILDLGLPRMDGLEVCRRIRADGNTVPVLILTARADEVDMVVGLDAGADDYVAKPFRLAELMARARALLRRTTSDEVGEGHDSRVRVDIASRRAFTGDREVHLTAKEFDLLALLISEAGVVLTRERIMAEVWDENWFGSTKTLDVHVSSLRRKLGDDATDPDLIVTVRGVGLRFAR